MLPTPLSWRLNAQKPLSVFTYDSQACPWLCHDYVTSITQSISQQTHLENPILNEQEHFHCGELSVGDDLIKIKHSANGASEINNT